MLQGVPLLAAPRAEERGLEIIDLEYDVHAFQVRLPRLHIIDIDDFDPMSFL